MASRRYAHVNRNRCVSCGVCQKECPKDAVSVWRGCFAIVDAAACVGCGKCAKLCPAVCIEFVQREAQA